MVRRGGAWVKQLHLGGVLLAAAVCCGLLGCAEPRPANVLLVTLDTTRADHLGPYGFRLARTPALDRLAREGTTFDDATTAAPITLVAHSTLFTGLLPPAHGVRDNGAYALGDDATTLAERLQAEGFETRAFVSALVLQRRYGLAQGFDSYDDELWSEDQPKLFMIRDRPAARTAAHFSDWYARRLGTSPGGRRPFFAWVHFFDPHQPYASEARFAALAPSPYDAEIASADSGLEEILDALRASGELDRTLVIVTADHGESLGEHGEKTHAIFVYDATMRVPLLMRFPGLAPAGARRADPVHHVDVVPTVLAALGLPGGETTQGFDLLPVLAGKPLPAHRLRYGESLLSEVGFGMAPLLSVRRDGYKWIRVPRPELYDLSADPRELVNLEPPPPGPPSARARVLDRALTELLADSERRKLTPRTQAMDEETLETLQALGYLAPKGMRDSLSGVDPKDGIVYYEALESARHLAQAADWQGAAAKLRQLVQDLPRNLSAWNILGLVELRRRDYAAARDAYLHSLAIEPRQGRVHAMLGSLSIATGDLDAAESSWRRALEEMPGFVEAMAQLGLVESLRGHADAAKEWYRRAQAADPSFPRAHRLAGDAAFEEGDFAEALAAYRRALEILPGDLHALIQAGNSARRAGDRAAARGYFERAVGLRPDAWVPLYNLACLDAVSGDLEAALEGLVRARANGFVLRRLAESDPDLEAVLRTPAGASWLASLAERGEGGDLRNDLPGLVEDPQSEK